MDTGNICFDFFHGSGKSDVDEVTIDPNANWKAVEKPKDMSDDSEGTCRTITHAHMHTLMCELCVMKF